jgi:hypothetical protein
MAKSLNDILKGVNKSKEAPNDLTNLAMSPEGNKGEIDFAKKHKIQKHEDRVGNGDDIYNASNIKAAPYKKQDQKVYESEEELDEKYMGFKKLKASIAAKGGVRDPGAVAAAIGRKKYGKEKFQAAAAKGKKLGEEAECNHSGKGTRCEMHGDAACPGTEPKDIPKAGQKVLLDKKKTVDEASQYRSTYGMGKRGWASSKAGKVTFQDLHPLPKGGPSKSDLRSVVSKAIEGKTITKLPAGKAKGIKEDQEIVNEVAPPNPKIEAWIKSNKERFVKEYGKEKGMQVLYAKAWKMHGQSESGSSATRTEYTSGGTGANANLDTGTL